MQRLHEVVVEALVLGVVPLGGEDGMPCRLVDGHDAVGGPVDAEGARRVHRSNHNSGLRVAKRRHESFRPARPARRHNPLEILC